MPQYFLLSQRMILAGIIFTVALLTAYGTYYYFYPLVPKLSINGHVFTYDIALTEHAKERGLSGRKSLKDNEGMLFIYRDKSDYGFWMNEMLFPIDIIWIDDTTIADITPNVPAPEPGDEIQHLPIYRPKAWVNRVFEVKAGTTEKLGIKVGDIVNFNP